jgi:hypothetical protein
MALFNYATKEITLKIVYYGPGLSGKTTNLQYLHAVLNPETKGKLLSLSTESDRTLFFDFLPVELGKIRDFSIRFQLYTVPGQVRYNATRKVVLKGADAVVFVADSQEDMRDQNIESFENMRENLISNNINPDTIPIILQYNKRDLRNILSIEAIDQDLNQNSAHEVLEAVAIQGKGVEEAFKKITKLLLKDISRKHKIEIQTPEEKKEAAAPVKPIPEPKREPVKQDIFPSQKTYEIERPEPEIPAASVFGTPVLAPAGEEIDRVPEYEIEEAELIEDVEPVEAITVPEPASFATAAIPEFSEEVIVPEPEKPGEEPKPIFPELAETEPAREIARVEVRPIPAEKTDELSDTVRELSETMVSMTDTITLLRQTVSDLRTEVKALQYNIIAKKERGEKVPDFKDSNEFKELKREQKEIADLIRHIAYIFNSIKEKKSWFRFRF